MRAVLVGLGLAVGVYGGWLLLDLGWDNLVATLVWAAAGVLAHDGLIGPALVVGALVVARAVPPRVRAPITAGLIVLGTVTMTAVPVLGRFGERPDNPTLLDRNYAAGWAVFALLVVVVTAAAALRAVRHPTEQES